MRLLITGGCGFIGSNFIRYILKKYPGYKITNLDKLTYAGNLENLKDIENHKNYSFVKGDICDVSLTEKLAKEADIIVNLAACTHVDRSILKAEDFIQTNIVGTYTLLEAAKKNPGVKKFIQISCYDTKTRALTTEGLKSYKELKVGDRIFSLNPKTFKIEVKPIEKVIIQSYKGKMIHFKNQRIDLMVTPNHNMFIINTSKKKLLIEKADNVLHRSIFYMPEGHWIGKEEKYINIKDYGQVKTEDLMYILGIFIGDGFTAYQVKRVETKTGLPRGEYLKKSRGANGRFKRIKKCGDYISTNNAYRIFFDIPENDKCRKRVEKTLSNLGIKYHCHKGKAGTHLYFTSKIFMNFFDRCGHGACNKHIPRWALAYSPKYLRCLLKGLLDSDGSRSCIYYSSSKRLISDISELCVKLNLKPSIYEKYTTTLINNRKVHGSSFYVFIASTTKSISRHKINRVDYRGDIWCLKVKDNKNFLVERNGKFDFCGNTDEVYGSVAEGSSRESDPLEPNSPYSASKAAADLLARSYYVTYKLPVIITRSSNNFGPYQYPEKAIPLFITNLMESKKIPLYGDGLNVRDWLYVVDNSSAIDLVLHKGKPGEIYNIGGGALLDNKQLTLKILKALGKGEDFIEYVKDRPGHDRRYALDCGKIESLGWKPQYGFDKALKETVDWYKKNENWWRRLKDKEYKRYYRAQYGESRNMSF